MEADKMRFQFEHVDPSSSEFADVVACEVASFDNPYQAIFRCFWPIFGTESAVEKEAALNVFIEVQRQWARDDPDSVWGKVVDAENDNKLAGGMLMKIHETNPFAMDKVKTAATAYWYPPGSQRDYIDQCLELFSAPREKFMQKPHLYYYIGFVSPEYRQHGIADEALRHQCKLADELGLEVYLEAVSPIGVQIFSRHGFIPYGKVPIEPKRENPDEEWLEMERKMGRLRFWPMWRPVGGKFVSGEMRLPWDEEGLTGAMSAQL